MEFYTGQELKFKKDLKVLVWVDGILPAGQMGMKETHYRLNINGVNFDLPVSKAELLFVDSLEEEVMKKPEPKKVEKKIENKDVVKLLKKQKPKKKNA